MKLRDSLAENKSIRLQAEAETWQDAVKIGVDLLVAADVVEPRYYQAILDAVEQHGPFAWGKDAHDAVHNAVVMEEVAKMAWIARSINPQLNHIDSFLMNKHFMRKHGPNAYYGQK